MAIGNGATTNLGATIGLPDCILAVGIDSANKKCIECKAGKTIKNIFQSNSCGDITSQAPCATGFYYDSSLKRCIGCNRACTQCSGPLHSDCSACINSFFLEGTSCLSVCSDGKYSNKLTGTCDVCHELCATCTGPTETECPVCKNINGVYGITELTTCGTCNPKCLNCMGPLDNQCSECINPNYKTIGENPESSLCSSVCEAGYYKYITT